MTETFADLVSEAADLTALLRSSGLRLATAESCTGGLIAASLTELPGSSAVFERGFVTYSNEAKAESLGVDPALIAKHGAVSSEVAVAMVEGALNHSPADVAVAVTGIAGPGGGSAQKPVGMVHLAAGLRDGTLKQKQLWLGLIGREAIRLASAREALRLVRLVL